MAVYSLGAFTFKVLQSLAGPGGAPELPLKMLDKAARGGVQGNGWIDLNSRGLEFRMRSAVDVPDDATAQALVSNYYAAVGGDKLAMVWRDADYYSLHSVKFEVVHFEAPRMRVLGCMTGGLNVPDGLPGVWVEGIWTLCPDVVS